MQDANTKPFKWEGDEDGELIDMAFSKKKVEDRKRWLRGFKARVFHMFPKISPI